MTSNWVYNEFRQVGTDFANPQVVATYDRNQHSSTVDQAQVLIARLGITAGQQVIDLGCGTGTFAVQAALVGATVAAVDVSEAMLAYAQQKARAAGVLERIQFHHQGFLTYEHSGKPADFIVTQAALHHLPDFWKMVAFLRMNQMLRIGGTLYLWDTVFSFPVAEYASAINNWMQRAAKPADQGWTAQDFATHVREEYTTFTWIIERMLQDTGFFIKTIDRSSDIVSEYICRKE